MKSSDTDILVIAGWEGSGPDHWQSRMVKKLSSARLVEQEDWLYGSLDKAIAPIVSAVTTAIKPIVFVAHSAGCPLVAHAIPALRESNIIDRVKGGYLVSAPSEKSLSNLDGIDPSFKNFPRDPLPFPTLLVASSSDPYASMEEQADIALAWGSHLVEAGDAGHLNTASGHGPWPEGMLRFAAFLSKLNP